MTSMNRPSRGARESVTTTRYVGFFVVPARLNRIATATSSPPDLRKSGQLHARKLALKAFELLHHLPELRVLLEETVDVLHVRPAAPRNALPPAAIDDLGPAALLGRQRRDDRVEPAQVGLLGVELLGSALEHLAERQHAEDLIEGTQLSHLPELIAEVLQRERVLAQLAQGLLGLLLIDGRLRLLDEREHVAHPEDARGHAVGMKWLQRVCLLADADVGDGPAGDVADGQRGAAARVAVELGENHRVDADGLIEAFRDRDRVLARHRIDDEEDVMRLQLGADGP